MLHLGDDDGVGSNDNAMEEISLPLGLSAGILYIIQRFLNQIDENELNEDENGAPPEDDGVAGVNLQADDSEETDEDDDQSDDSVPTSGEGDMQSRESHVDSQEPVNGRPRTKRYRMPWTRTRRSQTPNLLSSVEPTAARPDLDGGNGSPTRARSRSPVSRDRTQPSPD